MLEKYERENTTKEHEFNLKMKQIIAQKDDETQQAKQKVTFFPLISYPNLKMAQIFVVFFVLSFQ